MTISNPHNLNQPPAATSEGRFGIRVSLPDGDPFARLLDDDWTATHWFASAADRNAALADMQRKHEYSRPNDKPSLVFEAIERDSD